MTQRKRKMQGFTLVEILIVVVILGILAAIVVPQFTSASETAQANSMVATLQTVRSQLELYKVQHNGNYPTLAQLWTNLITATNASGSTAGTNFGPYLQKAPVNPFNSSSTAAAATGATVGWVYTGGGTAATTIQAVVSATTATKLGLDAGDFIAAP